MERVESRDSRVSCQSDKGDTIFFDSYFHHRETLWSSLIDARELGPRCWGCMQYIPRSVMLHQAIDALVSVLLYWPVPDLAYTSCASL